MIVPIGPVNATQPATAPTRRGCGQRQQPRERDLARDAPLHGGQPATSAGAEDRTGGDLRGGQGEAEVRRDEDHRRAAGLGGEALRCLDLADALAERLDDPPAAEVGAQRDRQARGEDHPERRRRVRRAAHPR